MAHKRFFIFWILVISISQFLMGTRYPSLAVPDIPIFSSYCGTIAGEVLSSITGLPIEGAEVKADGFLVKTDDKGHFALSELLPGKYTISYSATGYEPQRQENILVRRNITTYVPNIILSSRAGIIRGKVLNVNSGTPMVGVRVTANSTTTYTDSDGDFYFSLVQPGTYSLFYYAPGSIQVQENIQVFEQADTTVPTVLMPIIPEVSFGNRSKKKIALTIDDGYRVDYELVDLLKKYNVRATAFIVGEAALRHPDFVRYLDGLGWEVANHTFSHTNPLRQDDNQIANELKSAQRVITGITHKQVPFARPPIGTRDPRVINAINKAGYSAVYWTLDLFDTRKGVSLETQISAVLNRAQNGDILVCHFGGNATVEALSVIIPELQKRGFEVTTLSEVISP